MISKIAKSKHLNLKPDSLDVRDFRYQKKNIKIPSYIDISQFCSPVDDQGNIGSCVSCSIINAVEFLYQKSNKNLIDLSRLFLYYFTRTVYERVLPNDDSGAEIRNGIKAMAKFGSCPESIWPYFEERYCIRPSPKAIKNAKMHQAIKYYRLSTLQQIKSCIASGYPVVGGFYVPSSILSIQCEQTGIIKFPTSNKDIIGGHAILFVGYNDSNKLLKFKNSWSMAWGNSGYGYLPYRYITSGMASDFWTIKIAEL